MDKREKDQEDSVVTFGAYQLNLGEGRLWRGKQEVKLTPKALAALSYFVAHPGQLVTKDDLFAVVWPQTVVSDATLSSCIQEVRRALRDDAKKPRYIETMHRRGYCFIGEVVSSQHSVVSSKEEAKDWKLETNPSSQASSLQSPAPTLVDRDSDLAPPHNLLSKTMTGERRQLTVMFIDLVGSTMLSQQLDPEDYHARVVAYQAACHQIIARYEGHIAQYLGDGVLVYFGYPSAHDDDAVRAVRSSLEIVTAVGQLEGTPPLQVRIGIHTGPTVVGEIGAGARTERLALGETPNLAARVQGEAAPNTVMISQATYGLVHGLFACEALGPQALKNVSVPMELYWVHGAGTAQNRFDVSVQTGLTPLVGRAEELALLHRRWEHAQAGDGQVVLVSGEPGIGKSRLVQELKEQLAHEGVMRVEFRCSPYHQNSALYPIIEHLQRLLQFAREDTPAAKLEKLQHTLSHYRFPQADTVPLLAALLSLPHPVDSPPLTGSPQKQKEKTQAALVAWLVEEAEKAAVYCAWEDLHWADPSTLEVLALFLDQVPTTQMLALLTFRPEFVPPWGNRSHFSQLTLRRLGHQQVEEMVERVTGGRTLSSQMVQQIVAKTDGVPLFVEELTKTVLESVESRESVESGEKLNQTSLQLGIPATLQDALMARLDRLGTAKEVAQLGATIGREFSYELLQAISRLDEDRLQQGLKQLVAAELVYQRGLLPQAHYLFKHALIQDTAYQSLLKSTRQQYHRQIGQVLTDRFPETAETQPELVAHHYTEAGLRVQAIPYWQKAGERATQRSAYVEAISHLTKGLEVLKTLVDAPERIQQELTLQLALSHALLPIKGYAAPEVGQAGTRARELCQQLGETPQLFPVLFRLIEFSLNRGELQTLRELAEQLMRLAQSVHDPHPLSVAHLALGATFSWLGELPSAWLHVEQAIALYDPQTHLAPTNTATDSRIEYLTPERAPWLEYRWASNTADHRIECLAYATWTLWPLGYPDQSLKRSQELIVFAEGLSQPLGLAYALAVAAWCHQRRREEQLTRERAETLITLATEQGIPYFWAWGIILRGWALAEQGQGDEGIVQLRQGLATWRATGARIALPSWLALLAEAYEKVGQAKEGLSALAEALDVVDKTGERIYEAELYRLRGELLLQQKNKEQKVKSKERRVEVQTDLRPLTLDPQGEAEACFLKAIEIACQQQAKSWELRATMSLSRLRQQQALEHRAGSTEQEARTKLAEAHLMLSEVYNWFTEGFDTKDLQEAKALLTELSH